MGFPSESQGRGPVWHVLSPSWIQIILLKVIIYQWPFPIGYESARSQKAIYIRTHEQCVVSPSVISSKTGWFTGIPLLDYSNPQYMKGSIIPKLIINQQMF